MNVSCPQCDHAYKLDESRIPENGQRMRCPKCTCTFRVYRDGRVSEATSMSPSGATDTMPARPSVAPKRPQRGPRPSGLGDATTTAAKDLDADLPAPKSSSLFDLDMDLPAPKAEQPDPFGEIDLPTPASVADLPAPRKAPKPLFGADIPEPDRLDPFGDLPMPSKRAAGQPAAQKYEDPFADIDLPTPATGVDLPTPKRKDPFGEIDLPTPVTGVDLPTPKRDDPFGEIDLPTPSTGADLPTPKYEDPFGDIDLPTPSGVDLPTPSGVDLPTPAGAPDGLAPKAFSAAPPPGAASPPASPERVRSSGTTNYGEIDLGGAPERGGSSDEFDEFPTAEDTGDRRSGLAIDRGGLDLAESPGVSTGTIIDNVPSDAKDRKGAKFEGRRRLERQSRRVKVTLLSLLVLFVVGGAALTFTDFGPFGVNLIAELLPDAAEDRVVNQTKSKIEKRLQADTYAALEDAIRELESARREYPENEDLTLLGVFLHNWHEAHFRSGIAHIQKATRLLGSIDLDKSESPYALIAKSSGDVATLRGEAAVKDLSKRPTPSPDELALLVEALLTTGTLYQP